jgi:hypothetical protein
MLMMPTEIIIKSRDIVCLNKLYGAWIQSKNDTSVNDDSDIELDNLKVKIETELPFNDAPNGGNNF